MSDVHAEIPPVLLGGTARMTCPHCGAKYLDNFVYMEDIQNFRKLISLRRGVLMIQSFYEVADDGHNPRLLCKTCDKECAIPDDLEYDWM